MQEFYNKLSTDLQINLGYCPPNLAECKPNTGEYLRFSNRPNKDEMYLLISSWEYKKQTFYKAYFGDWRFKEIKYECVSYGNTQRANRGFVKYEELADKDHNENMARKKKIKYLESYKKHNSRWLKAKPAQHWYLDEKQINPYLSKVFGNTLYIPTYDKEMNLHGFQVIYRDKEDKPRKIFPKGLSPNGQFCHLKDFRDAELIYMVEGFGTAASLQMAIDYPVVCGFGTSNIIAAAKSVREINPEALIVFAVDNDEPGITVGRKALKEFPKAKMITPETVNDWNDLYRKEGPEAVKKQSYIEVPKKVEELIKYLGHDDEGMFHFFTKISRKKIALSASSLNIANLLTLIPNLEFWALNFPSKSSGKPDLDAIQAEIIAKQYAVGKYRDEKVRGQGVWKDQNQVVVHNFSETYNKPENSKYFYQPDEAGSFGLGDASLNNLAEVKKLYQLSSFKNKDEHLFMAGFYLQSLIFPIMEWRYNVYLSGRAGQGKSWHVDTFEDIVQHEFKAQNTSPTGILRDIKNNQTVVIHDEFEPKIKYFYQIIDVARTCNRRSEGANFVRATQSGGVVKFSTNAIFLFAGIQTGELNEADRGRIVLIELGNKEGQSKEDFKLMEKLAENTKANWSNNLAAAVERIPLIQDAIKFLKSSFKDLGLTDRQADTLSAAFGCYYALDNTEYDEARLTGLIESVNIHGLSFMIENQTNEASDAFSALMGMIVKEGDKLSLGSLLYLLNENNNDSDETGTSYHHILSSFGLIFYRAKKQLFISHTNPERKKRLPQDYVNITKLIRRDEERIVEPEVVRRLHKHGTARGIIVDISDLVEMHII